MLYYVTLKLNIDAETVIEYLDLEHEIMKTESDLTDDDWDECANHITSNVDGDLLERSADWEVERA